MKTLYNSLIKFSLSLGLAIVLGTLLWVSPFNVRIAQADAPLLNENFDYGGVAGDLTTLSGGNWAAHSGSGNGPIQYSTSSLSMANYCPSGVAGSATFGSGSEDVNRAFTTQSSGIVYYAGLVNISAASGGTYFFHLKDGGFGYRGRIFAQDSGGNLRFGLSSSSGTGTYTTTNFSYNTTYLLVVKYNIDTAAADLHVLSAFSATEPAALISTTGTAGIAMSTVAIRQGSGGPTGTIDGIRVANT